MFVPLSVWHSVCVSGVVKGEDGENGVVKMEVDGGPKLEDVKMELPHQHQQPEEPLPAEEEEDDEEDDKFYKAFMEAMKKKDGVYLYQTRQTDRQTHHTAQHL